MSFSAVFPGQGSQSLGMLAELADSYPLVAETFAEGSELLDYDLWRLVQSGPAEQLNLTQYTQPAMLVAGVAAWRVWRAQGGAMPHSMAGHSLGEYSALVAAGAMPLAEATRLVGKRGEIMQGAVPEGVGSIAAILGLTPDQVMQVCNDSALGQVVEAVNFNSPNQVVIAGHVEAVERAMANAQAAGAKRAMLLPVSVPVHSSLMNDAAAAFAAEIDTVDISAPAVPIVQNVEARAYDSVAEIKDALRRHVNSPVRWSDTIVNMAASGAELIVEFGPGKVLAGLCRRIDRGLTALCVESPASLSAALEAVPGGED